MIRTEETIQRAVVASPGYLYLELSLPPSVNKMFANAVTGRSKTKLYTAWIKAAGWELKAQIGGKRVAGPVGLILKFVRPDARKRDLDNLIKPTADLLCRHNVIDDDSEIQRIEAEWVPTGAPCQLMIISTKEVA